MRLAWATDIHLNWLESREQRQAFYESLRAAAADAMVLTGDVADGPETSRYLVELEGELEHPIYFVLGNHDFYGRSIGRGRRETIELAARSHWLVYLTTAGLVELTPQTAIVGHDSWGDARLGSFEKSRVWISDFLAIEDLLAVHEHRDLLRQRLECLGDEAARHFAAILPQALQRYSQVVVATHVPPFREAAWHQGEVSDDAWLPFFACRAVGDVLVDIMAAHPDRKLLVLCGHTHGGGEVQILDNLRVVTGEAREEQPRIQRVLELA